MRVYLAGPMTGLPEYNFPAFRNAARELRAAGMEVVSPVELDEADGFAPSAEGDGLTPDEYASFLARDIEAIVREGVQAIFVLEGWEQSPGARAEVAFARALGLPVWGYPCLDEVPENAPVLQAAEQQEGGMVRTFATGATRDVDEHKPDHEGFLSPLVIRAFGDYMHGKRIQPDGALRASDNWQKGIPRDAYMKSMWRHFLDVWTLHRGHPAEDYDGNRVELREALCAMLFNVQGMLHELLVGERAR